MASCPPWSGPLAPSDPSLSPGSCGKAVSEPAEPRGAIQWSEESLKKTWARSADQPRWKCGKEGHLVPQRVSRSPWLLGKLTLVMPLGSASLLLARGLPWLEPPQKFPASCGTAPGQGFRRAVGHSASALCCSDYRRLNTEANPSLAPPTSVPVQTVPWLGAGNGCVDLNSCGSNWQVAGLRC